MFLFLFQFFSFTFHITSGWRGYSPHLSFSFVTYSLAGLSYVISLLPSFLQYLNCIFCLHLWLFSYFGGLVSYRRIRHNCSGRNTVWVIQVKFLWGLGRVWGVTHLAYHFSLVLSVSLVGFPLFHLHGNLGFCFLAFVSVSSVGMFVALTFSVYFLSEIQWDGDTRSLGRLTCELVIRGPGVSCTFSYILST